VSVVNFCAISHDMIFNEGTGACVLSSLVTAVVRFQSGMCKLEKFVEWSAGDNGVDDCVGSGRQRCTVVFV